MVARVKFEQTPRAPSAAGLPPESLLHGLRKPDGGRITVADATDSKIAPKLGHSDTRTASIYSEGANQQRRADAAI